MNNYIPVLLLNELVIFPGQEIKIDLSNELSKKIIKQASKNNDDKVLVISPKNALEAAPSIEDLPSIGVIAIIKSKLELSNGKLRVVLRGLNRTKIDKYFQNANSQMLKCTTTDVKLPKYAKTKETAIRRKLINLTEKYIASSDSVSNSIIRTINETTDLNIITDVIASFLSLSFTKKISYMENINSLNRAISLIEDLQEELAIIDIDKELDEKLQESLENGQREYILKEKLKEINNELGNTKEESILELTEKINSLNLDPKTTNKLLKEVDKYANCSDMSPESANIKNYLDTIVSLPWHDKSIENDNVDEISSYLNETHYGLLEVKERILEYIAIKKRNSELSSPVICLVGPPGVGKTTIAQAIAKSLNREFIKVSVGGLNDSVELIGTRRTYLGAVPGKIIQGIIKSGVNNPLMLIDEVDKMVKDYKGDPASTLLEILDETQNNAFVDNYIEEPFDISNVLFMLTANDIEKIPKTILDRVEVINLSSYTVFDKVSIAKDYIYPNILKEHNSDLKISKEVITYIVENYTKEPGVRELKRLLERLVRKIETYEKNAKSITINLVNKYLTEKVTNYLPVVRDYGITNVLAYTTSGGQVTHVEVVKYKGSGKIIITGNAGEVLKESIEVIISYLTSFYEYDFKNCDIHVHFLNAGQKKDGPSAGCAIASALISALTKKIVDSHIAFTGELSLKGDILPVGGLKEKLIAAKSNGITRVFIPESNMEDLASVPMNVVDELLITPVRRFEEIYDALFK